MEPLLLEIENLNKTFWIKSFFTQKQVRPIHALQDISMQIYRGEIFGLIGTSGSGKSTLAQCIMNIISPDSGKVLFYGTEKQMIFQHPAAVLNPKMTIAQIICEPMKIARQGNSKQQLKRAKELLELVELNQSYLFRYASQLSGGQQQRVCIARALVLNPELLVADEPISAQDSTIQAQLMCLFEKLLRERQLSILLISHDLTVVKRLCHRMAVIENGKIIEQGDTKQLFLAPKHPKMKQLTDAVLQVKSQ